MENLMDLRVLVKVYEREIESYRSGEKYIREKELRHREIRFFLRRENRLKAEIEKAHQEAKQIFRIWYNEYQWAFERLTEERRKREIAEEKYRELHRLFYEVSAQLEDEKEKNKKLHAQINRDFENSSIPSSKSIKPKKITNNREKSGRKPGGQPGHKHHGRKKQSPTSAPILLEADKEVMKDPAFYNTGKMITKQLVSLHVDLGVQEYQAYLYRNRETGELYHAPFPEGVTDDVNYDGSVRAFAFLLNNECNVSIDKTRRFLKDVTSGKLDLSKGMINGLCRKFAAATREQRKEAYKDLLLKPVLHTDCTNARYNGTSAYVFICAAPDGEALYTATEKKGHEGVRTTLVRDYQGILVHDHETTFYSYGSNHQECNAHILRYLKDSIQNEPERTWNRQMYNLIREMVHYRNSLPDGQEPDPKVVSDYEERYDTILKKANEEYEDIPPSDYYRDGYNLQKRMWNYRDNHLLFLHDIRVPTTNNMAERLLRNYKRKQAQAVSFRSFESIGDLCDSMSVLLGIRQRGEEEFFREVAEAFE